MTKEQCAWLKKPYVEENSPHYLFANLDLKPAKRARLRLNYSTMFVAFSILAGIACALYERFGR